MGLIDQAMSGRGMVTMGRVVEEHSFDCKYSESTGMRAEHGCQFDCEIMNFSRSSCDGCGSTLGGERHAFTVWFED
jgi:hypothetical protein